MKKVIAIVGPNGVGKTTLINYLTEKYDLITPICVTTRKKRNEQENYIFVNDDEFFEYEKKDCFLLKTGENEKYGYIYPDKNDERTIVISTSYKNVLNIKSDEYNLLIIQLAYSNIDDVIRQRLSKRDMKSNELEEKIRYAYHDYDNYFENVYEKSEILLYTDLYSLSEMLNIVEYYLIEKKIIQKKQLKLVREC